MTGTNPAGLRPCSQIGCERALLLEERRHASQTYPARQGPRCRGRQRHATLEDAAKLLTEKRIGALVVKDDDGTLIGIISERDLVRAIAKDGALP